MVLFVWYKLIFIFENIINYSIYVKKVFQVVNINKNRDKWQIFLKSGWYIRINRNITP